MEALRDLIIEFNRIVGGHHERFMELVESEAPRAVIRPVGYCDDCGCAAFHRLELERRIRKNAPEFKEIVFLS